MGNLLDDLTEMANGFISDLDAVAYRQIVIRCILACEENQYCSSDWMEA